MAKELSKKVGSKEVEVVGKLSVRGIILKREWKGKNKSRSRS